MQLTDCNNVLGAISLVVFVIIFILIVRQELKKIPNDEDNSVW